MSNKYIFEDLTTIYCDGGQNSHTKDEAWGSVVDCNKNDIIEEYKELLSDMKLQEKRLKNDTRYIIVSKFNDVETAQNNGAELLALVASLRIANKFNLTKVINCDSELLVKWWSKGHINSKTALKMDPKKLLYINECSELRKTFERNGGKIVKISGSDNLADLGWH
jgi:ribonuclease HI